VIFFFFASVLGTFVEVVDGKRFNTCVVLQEDGSILGIYRKRRDPDVRGSQKEKKGENLNSLSNF
jgi:predicted amidohydrolase